MGGTGRGVTVDVVFKTIARGGGREIEGVGGRVIVERGRNGYGDVGAVHVYSSRIKGPPEEGTSYSERSYSSVREIPEGLSRLKGPKSPSAPSIGGRSE